MNSTWKLKGMLFFFHSAMTMLISYLPVYFQQMGLTGSQIGVLLAVGPAAAIIAQPFWGFVSDKYKTVKRVILLCLAGALAVGFVVFQMAEFILLIPLLYFFFSFMSPAGALQDSLAQKVSVQQGVSFGSIRMWGSLGFGTASLVGGYILSHIGVSNMYYLYAFFICIALFFCYIAPDSVPSKKPVMLTSALKLMKNGKLAIFLLMVLAISLTHRMNDSFLGLYIVELGGDESHIGLAWFIGVTAEAVVFALSVYWFRKYHALTFITVAGFLYAIRWLLMSFAPDPSIVLIIQVLHGVTFAMFYLTAFQFLTKLVPEELTSTGHLLFISVFFGISGVIGSIVGGSIINVSDVRLLYTVMFGLSVVGFISALIYRYFYFKSDDGQKDRERMKEAHT
ncbi:MFS transporter [Bacillus shivajii]|uniref:MFS transporter n=1 Tax=Bacillus shivajii TaxID=1983719 RepID=UPI001CFA0AFD|nr:MFS transporter [Bacillus shivajii]UCZ51579.1 MFS transporter [Bacillus shivajii]